MNPLKKIVEKTASIWKSFASSASAMESEETASVPVPGAIALDNTEIGERAIDLDEDISSHTTEMISDPTVGIVPTDTNFTDRASPPPPPPPPPPPRRPRSPQPVPPSCR
jgi:hypothetical protein